MTDPGELRVWWVPQIPMQAFYVTVGTVAEGRRLLEVLADYDLFQLEHHVKPDFANAGGLERWDGEDWEEIDPEED